MRIKHVVETEQAVRDATGKKCHIEFRYGDGQEPQAMEGEVIATSDENRLEIISTSATLRNMEEDSTDVTLFIEGGGEGIPISVFHPGEAVIDTMDSLQPDFDYSHTSSKGAATTNIILKPVIVGQNWLKTFSPGLGVDFLTGEIKNSPFEKLEFTENEQQEAKELYELISDERSCQKEFNASLSGNGNIEGVDISGAVSYLTRLEYSEISTTIVAKYEQRSAIYSDASSPKLTTQAKELMAQSRERFRARYGDYFISGYTKGAAFHAIYNCYATSSSKMRNFKLKVSSGLPDVFSVSGSTKLKTLAESCGVRIKVYIYRHGFKGVPPTDPVEPGMILSALKWFKENIAAVPLKAKLTHYSMIDESFTTTLPVPGRNLESLLLMYDKVWRITGKFDSCPEVYQNALRAEYMSLMTGLGKDQEKLARDTVCLTRYDEKVDILLKKLNDISDRQSFYYKVKDLIFNEPITGQRFDEGNGHNYWCYGLESATASGVRIEKCVMHYKDNYKTAGHRQHTFVFGPDSGRLIVGWSVKANWTDGTCGYWMKVSDRILLGNAAQIFIKSKYSRGFNWTVQIAYVNTADYRFE